MTPEAMEWIEKAEEDWVCAQEDARRRKHPTNNAACFHAQQCAEKYLKARLQEANVVFQKTHNLLDLLTLVLAVEPNWNALQSDLAVLNNYGVDFRYPGKSATKAQAKAAVNHCRTVRNAARQSFGLPV
ncbi:MAG: HEPN domain-containing protein [Blastocatellia bacterium]